MFYALLVPYVKRVSKEATVYIYPKGDCALENSIGN